MNDFKAHGYDTQLLAADYPDCCRSATFIMTAPSFSCWSPSPVFYLRFLSPGPLAGAVKHP
jgi:hypothetical protein